MFDEIEARRRAADIQQIVLCEKAGVHPTTYTARKNGRRAMSEATIRRLSTALDTLVAAKRQQLDRATAGGRDA